MEIWTAGCASLYGGADSELLGNIELWLQFGVEVHCVALYGSNSAMNDKLKKQGVKFHLYEPGIFKDKVVASWCNAHFLHTIHQIVQERPKTSIWFNSMTWPFQAEKVPFEEHWIDLVGYVSAYQRVMLRKVWRQEGFLSIPPDFEGYKPYFNANSPYQNIRYAYNPPDKHFGVGRISRDDSSKYADDTWDIFSAIKSPLRPTHVYILGFGKNTEAKIGPPPEDLGCTLWPPNGIAASEFFKKIHVLVHKTGGSRESFGRFALEACAAGIPVIVEDDYAFREIVRDGETGFLCKTSQEMVERATELAQDEEKRRRMGINAHAFLIDELASLEACWQPWARVLGGV